MTDFLFIVSSDKKSLEKAKELFPTKMKHQEEINDKGLQIIIRDFEKNNYELKIKKKNYHFSPNILKHKEISSETSTKKGSSENIQPFIEIDLEKKEAIISTDPMGTDFIYFSYVGNTLYISSQMKYILQSDVGLLGSLDYDAMLEYVFSHCILGMKTFFKNIKLLPYNRTIRINYNKIESANIDSFLLANSEIKYQFPTDYKKMDMEDYNKTVEEQALQFRDYFTKILNLRDNNNYFLLSGGLDSRTLITAVDQDIKSKYSGITFDYSSTGQNVTYAKKVAEILDVEHIVRIIDVEDTVRDSIKHMWFCEGVSTHVASRLVSFLEEVETKNNLYIDGYLGDTQFGGEFFTCIKEKNIRKDASYSLLKAMQLHNYFFPPEIFEKMAREKNILKRSVIPELKKHSDLLWKVNNKRMQTECLLALTRGRKYTIGGPKTVENYGTTILPFYHPQIFSTYIKIPYELREKRNFELDILNFLNEDIAMLPTTSSKFKRLKIVQNSLKAVRWFERKLGVSIIPKSYAPIYKWTDEENSYYKFINKIIQDDNSFIWNLFNKDEVRKQFDCLFKRKSHLELFLSAFIDLEIMMRLYFGLHKPDKISIISKNLNLKVDSSPLFEVYDIKKIISE